MKRGGEMMVEALLEIQRTTGSCHVYYNPNSVKYGYFYYVKTIK